jgi:DNA-directed RNA polymerase subunit RPC12/RpoP
MERDKLAIMIYCPRTRKPVKTGISMNSQLFRNATIEGREVRCPHCGHIHVWSKKDAHLAGEQD